MYLIEMWQWLNNLIDRECCSSSWSTVNLQKLFSFNFHSWHNKIKIVNKQVVHEEYWPWLQETWSWILAHLQKSSGKLVNNAYFYCKVEYMDPLSIICSLCLRNSTCFSLLIGQMKELNHIFSSILSTSEILWTLIPTGP